MAEQKSRRSCGSDAITVVTEPAFQPGQDTSPSLLYEQKKIIRLSGLTALCVAFHFFYFKAHSQCVFLSAIVLVWIPLDYHLKVCVFVLEVILLTVTLYCTLSFIALNSVHYSL